ncbi:MAG: sensor histidine kinase [Blautia sp.]|nr:sensor histidine kinase [Blautia sp.]MDY5030731.1 sensor histidine kinase [Blautia sp.]
MNHKNTSLTGRLNMLLAVCFIPFALIMVYLLIMAQQFSVRYDIVVDKITKANTYNLDMKEEIDYTMYVVVVNSERASEIVDVNRPHELIAGARKTFSQLMENTEDDAAKGKLVSILKCLKSLENAVAEIEQDVRISGSYDKNMERLDLNIRILTELIQENIQEYIYYESVKLQNLREQVRSEMQTALLISTVISISAFIVALLISRRISDNLTEGIRQLQRVTRKVGQGDFTVRACSEDNDEEIAELEEGFNHMVERIDNLVEDIKTEQFNQRVTEQKLLQAQINPHFLYNTLDAIIWQAEAGEKEQVVMMVTALSDFFRTTLSKGRDFISVKEEESHIRSYLKIQRFRYQDILEYEINIPEELYQYQILKLMLQPLVENALYHGIKNKRGMGHILVTGQLEDDTMIFRVKDNGMGMTEERLEQVKKEMGKEREENSQPSVFGLFNVVERIRLYYGPSYGMELFSVYGEGTEAVIRLPAVIMEPASNDNSIQN